MTDTIVKVPSVEQMAKEAFEMRHRYLKDSLHMAVFGIMGRYGLTDVGIYAIVLRKVYELDKSSKKSSGQTTSFVAMSSQAFEEAERRQEEDAEFASSQPSNPSQLDFNFGAN